MNAGLAKATTQKPLESVAPVSAYRIHMRFALQIHARNLPYSVLVGLWIIGGTTAGCGPNVVAKDHCKEERNTYNLVLVSLTALLHELIDAAHLSICCCETLTGTFELTRQKCTSQGISG